MTDVIENGNSSPIFYINLYVKCFFFHLEIAIDDDASLISVVMKRTWKRRTCKYTALRYSRCEYSLLSTQVGSRGLSLFLSWTQSRREILCKRDARRNVLSVSATSSVSFPHILFVPRVLLIFASSHFPATIAFAHPSHASQDVRLARDFTQIRKICRSSPLYKSRWL